MGDQPFTSNPTRALKKYNHSTIKEAEHSNNNSFVQRKAMKLTAETRDALIGGQKRKIEKASVLPMSLSWIFFFFHIEAENYTANPRMKAFMIPNVFNFIYP